MFEFHMAQKTYIKAVREKKYAPKPEEMRDGF
jgi:hypothetical protein